MRFAMKQLYLLLLLLGGILPQSQAQTFSQARAYMHGFSLGLGYNQTTFINSQFGQMLKEGIIQRQFGHSINTRIVASPIIFDLNFYASRFRVENNPDPRWMYADTSRIWHAGAEIGFSIPVILTARHLVPYLGLAYHNGFLGVNTDITGDPLEDIAAAPVPKYRKCFGKRASCGTWGDG